MERKIVVIADEFKNITDPTLASNNMEGNSEKATQEIVECVQEVASTVLYTHLPDFCDNILFHKNDLIFPMRYGTISRTEKGLIPSMCEANNLSYIGADVYTHILCNDKRLAKLYATEFGFLVPAHFLCRKDMKETTIKNALSKLAFPLVIKPNFGGGSSGISKNNIVYSINEAYALITKLISYHGVPVMAEQYIPGYEVSLLLIGNKNTPILIEETELIMDNKAYFTDEIWGYETKKLDDSSVDYITSSLISAEDKEKALSLYQSFDKVDYMRIDGRISNQKFYVLELSPDCYLGPDSDFAVAFKAKGKTYKEFIKLIVTNSLNLG